jgi:hypothetical protein
MPKNRDNADLMVAATQMIIGAGESIELKMRYLDAREFGLDLEDIAQSVDQRLSLRCLLPLPGIYRDRDGSITKDRETTEDELAVLKSNLAVLEEVGWNTRLIPDRPLVSSLCVDDDSVIYYEYLNEPPGPFMSSKRQEVAHYRAQFAAHWKTSFALSDIEMLYEQAKAIVRPTGDSQIALVSHEAWTELIGRLSANPRMLHEIPSRKFEELVAELLCRDGLEVHLTPATRDGGRDVLAFHKTPVGRLLYLVECKRHTPGNPVGIAIVQRLYGVVMQERATAGLVVTTSRFTKEALTFAETVRHQFGLRDYEALKDWMKRSRKAPAG